jgi:imidazolonepropionase-like amidohydrolase
MWKHLIVTLPLLVGCSAATSDQPKGAPDTDRLKNLAARINPAAPTTRYINGKWYQNGAFARVEKCAVEGIFQANCPEDATVVDLADQYIVPPYGEAHNHNLDGPWTSNVAKQYIEDGVFYMLNLNSVNSIDRWASAAWETADTVDIAWSHAGLSIDEGHPEELYRSLAGMYRLDPEKLEGDIFYDIPNIEALDAKWPEVMATNPDVIKLYLLDVDQEYSERAYGLSREVFRAAVAKAKEADLRTAVHVYLPSDMELAVDAGADMLAHMPPTYLRASVIEKNSAAFDITEELAKKTARQGTIVIPTTSVATDVLDKQPEALERTRAVQAANLKKLIDAGVTIALGSDRYQFTGLDEAKNVLSLGVMDDAKTFETLIKTPSVAIFPERAIGALSPGFEASFLALSCNPTQDFSCADKIQLRVKQGFDLVADK